LKENFSKFVLGAGAIGVYVGTIIEQRYLDTSKYIYFNDTGPYITILRIAVCGIISLPTLATHFLIPKDSPFWMVLIFR